MISASNHDHENVKQQLTELRDRIAAACAKWRRPVRAVELLAVSKGQPPSAILAACAAGQRRFGENYVQELVQKATELAEADVEWVFIGRIQSNKIPLLVKHAAEIQTVSDLRHAQLIDRQVQELGKAPYPVWIAINAGDEASKSGIPLADVHAFATQLTETCQHLRLRGVMSIPPQEFSDAMLPNIPPLYLQLADCAREAGQGQLSLGMTSDMELAIAAGSNCLRIGTALFGPRPSRSPTEHPE